MLMDIFNKSDVVSQAKLSVYATELEKEKAHRPIIPIMIKNSKIKYPKFR